MSDEHARFTARSARDVTLARRSLREALVAWGCGQLDDGLLVFDELASNAVKHAGGVVLIDVTHGDHELRFDVRDHSHAVPSLRRAGITFDGFGLRFVSEIVDRWGWEQTADGKRVWGVVPCCPGGDGCVEDRAARRPRP